MGNTEATLRSADANGDLAKMVAGNRGTKRSDSGYSIAQGQSPSIVRTPSFDTDKKEDGESDVSSAGVKDSVAYSADVAQGTVRLRSPRWANEEAEGAKDVFSTNTRPRFMATPTRTPMRDSNVTAGDATGNNIGRISPGVNLPGVAYAAKSRAGGMAAAAAAVAGQFGIRPMALVVCFALGLLAGIFWMDSSPLNGVGVRSWGSGASHDRTIIGARRSHWTAGLLGIPGRQYGVRQGMSSADAAVAAATLQAARYDEEVHAQLTQESFQHIKAAAEIERYKEIAAINETLRQGREGGVAEANHRDPRTVPPPCSSFYKLNPYTGEELDGGIRPLLIVVTPTYLRPFQAMYLHRLANTLRQVAAPLLWIVVESKLQAADTAALLRDTGLVYRHIVSTKNMSNIKDRGVQQRNAALAHIEEHRLNGIVYFADDDNVYAPELFEEIRKIKRFGTWPVAMLQPGKSRAIIEGPVCSNGTVIGWHTNEKSARLRRFHVDMSGFAFNSTILWDPATWRRPTNKQIRQLDTVKEGFQETTFIEQLVPDESFMEGLANDCSRVLVWHVHIEAPRGTPYPRWSMPLALKPVVPLRSV